MAKGKSDTYTVQIEVIGIIEKNVSAESLEDAISIGRSLLDSKFFTKDWEEIDGKASVVGVQGAWKLYE